MSRLPASSMELLFVDRCVKWRVFKLCVEIVRGIFLRGSGIDMLWPDLLALGGLGVAVLMDERSAVS
jgi:hypothetical protein